MAGPVYTPEGIELPEEAVADAIASGSARFDARQTYDMMVKGIRMKVPGDQVWQNIQEHGGELESSSQAEIRRIQSSPVEIAKTALENAASTASFGISDIPLSAIGGEEYKKARQTRERALPGVAFGGQLAGTLPGFVEGGATGIGKVLGYAGAPERAVSQAARVGGEGISKVLGGGRVGRIGALATEGFVEGAAYQAGREVSDASIRDKELSAEAVLAGGLEGAAIGGTVGAVLGGIGGIKSPEMGEKSLRRFAREQAAASLHPKIRDLKRLGRNGEEVALSVQDIGEELLRQDPVSGRRIMEAWSKAEDVAPIADRELKKVGEEIGAIRKSVDKFIEKSTKGAKSEGIAPPVDMRGYVEKFLRKVDDEVLTPLQQSDLPATRNKAKRVQNQLSDLQNAYLKDEPISFARLEKFRRDLRDQFQPKITGPGVAPQVPAHAAELEKTERILAGTLEDSIGDAAGIIDPGLAKRYRSLMDRYGTLSDIKGIAGTSWTHDISNRVASPSDYGVGSMVGHAAAVMSGSGIVGLAKGAAAAGVHKVIRERGASAVAIAADNLASKMASRAQAAKIKLGSTVARGIKPVPMSSKIVSLATKGRLAYENTLKRVQDDSEFEKQTTKKISGIERAVPRTAARITATLAGDREYLKTLVPPTSKALIVGKDPTPPARSAMASMNRAAEVLDNPQTVADAIRNGDLSPDMAAAIRERRPELLETMREAAWKRLAELGASGKVPDHQSRITLSVLFDAPVEPLMEPARLKNLQQVHKVRYEEPSLAPAPGPAGSAGKKSQRTQTDTERLAGANS